jgi:hypothetical protein
MFSRIALMAFVLLLTACQTQQASLDFDASRDFAAYRTWAWKSPALQYRPDDPRIKSDLTEQRILQSVGDQLEQRGLRAAQPNAKADVLVQAYYIVDNRQQQISTPYGGGPWGAYWGGPWGPAYYNETRTIDYRVATLQVDLLDARDGKLVWRGSRESVVNDAPQGPTERSASIARTVGVIMSNYPPH